ncbi:MAG: PAS-domain containing protein [Proteobacteria bacterium]|nr:PAS-domain containing protein [Pseudomonadota bacterium]MBI3497709.1 PAS-domain containing protein [Pseudomonadota bacterium]
MLLDLLEGIDAAVTGYDAAGKLLYWNDAARDYFPLAAHTLKTGTMKLERDRAKAASGYLSQAEASAPGALSEATEEYSLGDGRRLRRRSRRTTGGRWLLSYEDVSETFTEERQLAHAIESMPVDFHIYDRDGRLIRASQKHTRVLDPQGADIFTKGTLLKDHMRHFWQHSAAAKVPEEELDGLIERRLASLKSKPDDVIEVAMADGRHLRVISAPTPEGGLIRIDLFVTDPQAEERRLRALLAALPIGVRLIERNGRTREVNDAYALLHPKRNLANVYADDLATAIRRDAARYILNHADGTAYTPEEREAWIAERIAIAESGVPEPVEFLSASGKILRITTARTPDGTLVQAHQDITDLRQTELKFRALLAVLPAGVRTISPDGIISEVNDAYLRIHEIPNACAIVGQRVAFRARTQADTFVLKHEDGRPYTPDERAEWVERRIDQLDHGNPEPVEARTASGRVVRVTSARTSDGTLIQVIQDISDLQSAQQRLQEAIENMPVGMLVSSQDGRIEVANEFLRRIYAETPGYPLVGQRLEDRLRGKLLEFLVKKPDGSPLDEAEMAQWQDARAASFKLGVPDQIEARTRNGTIIRITSARTTDGRLIQVVEDITELRRTELRLTDAIESMGSTFILFDAEDRLQICNQATFDLYPGLRTAFRKGATFQELNALAVAQGYVSENNTLASDPRVLGSYVRQESDGRHVLVRRGRTREGGALVMHTDMTAMHRAENRLISAINAATEGFALFDKDDRLVACNDGYRWELVSIAERVVAGVSIEEIWSWSWDAGLVSTDDAKTKEEWLESRRHRHRKAGGTSFEVRRGKHVLRVNEYVTREGELVRVSTDITELRAKEQALERSVRQIELLSEAELARRTFLLQSVLDTVPDGLVVLDEANRATFWNQGFLKLAGLLDGVVTWSEGLIRDQPIDALLAQSVLPASEMRRQLFESAEEIEHSLADGRHLRFGLLDASGGNRLLWISDQSLRRREEADRLAIQERLLQAQKSEAIGTMAGTIAHDFNNLLSIVLGFASLSDGQIDVLAELSARLAETDPANARSRLQEAAGAAEAAKKGLSRIVSAANRAREIVTGLNTFAKTKPSDLVSKDLAETVRSAAQLIGIALPAAISFDLVIDDAAHLVRHDSNKIEQVLVNLCLNAAHALGSRPGAIELILERMTVDGGRAEALRRTERELHAQGQVIKTADDGWSHLWRGVLRPGAYLRLQVRDTGSGMTREVMEKIFDPFFTTKPKGAGTGLGLPSVASIVEAHMGALHIKSKPGTGTACAILIPASERTPAHGEGTDNTDSRGTASSQLEESTMGRQQKAAPRARILVVDDEAYLADLMQITLSWAGYEVERYENPQSAWERLQEDAASFDLIITDQTMPGLTGAMLAERAQALRPNLPVLLCSGFSAQSLEKAKLPPGVAAVLLKPFTPRELVRVTKDVLGRATAER